MELFSGEEKEISESKYLWDALRLGHKTTTDFWKSVFLGEILTSFSSPAPPHPAPVPLMFPSLYHVTESISPTSQGKIQKESAETCPRAEAKLAAAFASPGLLP